MEKIPILKMGHFLLITIQVDMHDRLAMALQDDLTARVVKDQAKGVLIDISSLEVVDSFMGRMLGNIAAMTRTLGAETVVVGMRPAVAITIVELGLSLESVRTALTVDKGMAMLTSLLGPPSEGDGYDIIRSETLKLHSSDDVVRVRQVVRTWMVEMKFGLVDQTKMVTAASELTRNAVEYGGGGSARLEELENNARHGLRLVFEDHGPGIPDLDLALKDGYTTGGGLGLGLGGSKRLVNEFDIWSVPGEGTRVTIVRWK